MLVYFLFASFLSVYVVFVPFLLVSFLFVYFLYLLIYLFLSVFLSCLLCFFMYFFLSFFISLCLSFFISFFISFFLAFLDLFHAFLLFIISCFPFSLFLDCILLSLGNGGNFHAGARPASAPLASEPYTTPEVGRVATQPHSSDGPLCLQLTWTLKYNL